MPLRGCEVDKCCGASTKNQKKETTRGADITFSYLNCRLPVCKVRSGRMVHVASEKALECLSRREWSCQSRWAEVDSLHSRPCDLLPEQEVGVELSKFREEPCRRPRQSGLLGHSENPLSVITVAMSDENHSYNLNLTSQHHPELG